MVSGNQKRGRRKRTLVPRLSAGLLSLRYRDELDTEELFVDLEDAGDHLVDDLGKTTSEPRKGTRVEED
jgi:hypothetical protein